MLMAKRFLMADTCVNYYDSQSHEGNFRHITTVYKLFQSQPQPQQLPSLPKHVLNPDFFFHLPLTILN